MKKKPKLSLDILLLADPWVVASNINSTAKQLKKLSKNKHVEIRRAIASNPSTPDEILLALIHDADNVVKFDSGTRLKDKIDRNALVLSDKDLLDVIYIFHPENFEAMHKFNEIRKKEKKAKS